MNKSDYEQIVRQDHNILQDQTNASSNHIKRTSTPTVIMHRMGESKANEISNAVTTLLLLDETFDYRGLERIEHHVHHERLL